MTIMSGLVGRAIQPADPLSSGSSRLERRLQARLPAPHGFAGFQTQTTRGFRRSDGRLWGLERWLETMFFGEPSTWAPRHQIFKPLQKVVDETAFLKRPRRGSMLKEEVWESADGEVVRYSLAYMNPNICGLDNGRVLGYDNSHDHHHRHFMGRQESFAFAGYESLATRF